MRIVADILRTKGDAIHSVQPYATVYEALQLMAEKNIGAVLVMEYDCVIGVLSERDYARKVVLQGKSSLHTKVSEIMSDRVYYVRPEHTLDECMALMTEMRIRHLPVFDQGMLVGVISIGDVVKQIISDQYMMIEQLESYILGQ